MTFIEAYEKHEVTGLGIHGNMAATFKRMINDFNIMKVKDLRVTLWATIRSHVRNELKSKSMGNAFTKAFPDMRYVLYLTT